MLGAPTTPGNEEMAVRDLSSPKKAQAIEVQTASCVDVTALAANPAQQAFCERRKTSQRAVVSHKSAAENAWIPKKRGQGKKPSFLSSLTLPVIRPPASSSKETIESDIGSFNTMPSQTLSAQPHQNSAAEEDYVISDITRAVFLADHSSTIKEASEKQPKIAGEKDSNALDSENFHSI